MLDVFDVNAFNSDLDSLRRAHAIHPRSTEIGIQLALELERQSSVSDAEEELLQVASYNHQYLPAWTLANFYFRHSRPEQFWKWAAIATNLSFDDFRPLLRLARKLEADPATAALRLGARPELLRTLMDDLIGEDRLDQALEIARLLARRQDPHDQPRFLDLHRRLAARPKPKSESSELSPTGIPVE